MLPLSARSAEIMLGTIGFESMHHPAPKRESRGWCATCPLSVDTPLQRFRIYIPMIALILVCNQPMKHVLHKGNFYISSVELISQK